MQSSCRDAQITILGRDPFVNRSVLEPDDGAAVQAAAMETIILASGSPRRRELLTRVKLPIKVIPPDIVEDYSSFSSIPDKAGSIFNRLLKKT